MKAKLSTLWIFATFNYLYADVIALFDLMSSKKASTGDAVAVHMRQGLLFGIAIFMEIPIAMILLCRILPYAANRWLNISVGAIESLAVLALTFAMPLSHGTTPPGYYIFCGAIEIACTSFIVWCAWQWPREDA